ncbi:MAG: Dam family site-specific DNA-(adenine-N6)-methyltransferase [Lachnospiraceae bacterium]|nr:Dam family site-specific DNA-(adenine-N6)-methyltransferase [Lachnospiraceae bacterium]
MCKPYIKSPLNYTGGKYKMLDNLFDLFPQNIDIFVDMFAGGFNVGINADANKIICNDHINYLIELYEYLKDTETKKIISDIKKRIKEFDLSLDNDTGYKRLRERYNKKKNIIDFFVLICYSFNHQIRFNNSHEFNTPFGKDRSCYNDSIEKNLIAFSNMLKNKKVEFSNTDFNNLNYDYLDENDFVYCDPPYLITNGSYNDGKRGFKDWTEKEEQELLDLLDDLDKHKVRFALSNVFYHKGLTNELLINWSKKYKVNYINKSYSNCSYHFKDRGAKTVEVLITNY